MAIFDSQPAARTKEIPMPLENFGSILNFAEGLEVQNRDFFSAAAANPACGEIKDLLEKFAADGKKNIATVQRTRRENVTEMILEPIQDFSRAPFCEECAGAGSMGKTEALETARRLEDRAQRYYTEAADKIKALPEVSRSLKTLAKNHAAHLKALAELT
jgi:rubrerythrin